MSRIRTWASAYMHDGDELCIVKVKDLQQLEREAEHRGSGQPNSGQGASGLGAGTPFDSASRRCEDGSEPHQTKVSTVPCARCGGSCIEFSVPNDVWNAVVRLGGKERDDEYICEACYRKAVESWVRKIK